MGGLSKKASLIKNLAADPGHPALVVNGGNLLFKTDALPANDLEAAKLTADGIVQATRMMGGTLAGIGTRDLAAGIPFLRQHQKPPDFSLLSLNLVDPATRQPLFTPTVMRQVDSLQETVAKIRHEADFILLLSNYSLDENQEIARTCSDIDLILQAGHAVGNMTPILINKTLISQVETRGKYLGVLDIDWQGHGHWNEGTTYTNRFIALKLSMSNDPEVEALVQQTQQRVDKLRQGAAR